MSLWPSGLRPFDLESIWDAGTSLRARAVYGHGDNCGPRGTGMPLLNMIFKSKGELSAFNSLL